jgi:hypothetical protein
MASILRVNTLTDASSNNSTATSTIFNGTAKAWAFALDNAISDNFNVSGSTDNGTGNYTFALSASMANTTFAFTGATNEDSNVNVFNSARTTSSYTFQVKFTDNNNFDKNTGTVLHGDLA